MEFIESDQLLHCTGHLVPCEKAFKGRRIILLYFAASWSAACKQFLPKLKTIYQKSKEIHLPLEIIYISYDEDADIMKSYFTQRHGGWYAIPFGDSANWVLRIIYNITQIPMVIVLGPEGNVISYTGISDIEELGLNVLVAWNTMPPK